MKTMRANVFRGKDLIQVEEVERPRAGVGLDRIAEGYHVFGERADGVLEVAIRP